MTNKPDHNLPQRISLRYAISNRHLDRSLDFSKAEAIKRLEVQLANCLTEEMFCERQEVGTTIFELNGYFVTPQALEKLVQDRVHIVQCGYPVVDFY